MKISPSAIKNAIIAQGNVQNRLFDLGVILSDGTIAYLNVEKDTARTTTYKDGTWTDLYTLATKSDLTDIIMVKSFRGTSITVAGNASEKISIPISTPTGYKVVGKISEWWNNGPEMYLSQVDLTPTTFTGYAANLRNSEATSIPAINVLFVKS